MTNKLEFYEKVYKAPQHEVFTKSDKMSIFSQMSAKYKDILQSSCFC